MSNESPIKEKTNDFQCLVAINHLMAITLGMWVTVIAGIVLQFFFK